MDEPTRDDLAENDKVELAKALLAVRSIATEDAYDKVRAILLAPGTAATVDSAIRGLSQEDEFALMCRLMGTCTHLVPLEQRPIIDGDFLVPDFLARFQPGCVTHRKRASDSDGFRCLVEVKSTTKFQFKIGGKKLKRLRAFADQFGLPLIIAVRILRYDDYAFWLMVADADRTRNSIKVTVGALTEGVRHVLWNDFMYMVMPWIVLRTIYDSEGGDGSGGSHREYGRMKEFHVVSHPDHPISGENVTGNVAWYTGVNALMMSAFFEGFRPEVISVQREGSLTAEVIRPTVPCSMADMIYCFNRLARDDRGRVVFDPSRILAGSNDDAGLITRTLIERIASDLSVSVLGVATLGEPESQFQKWQAYGGRA